MSLTLSLALYFIIWWTTLFAVLPFGVRTQGEEGTVVPGTPASAPAVPRLVWVFLVNTVVSTAIFAAVWIVIVYRFVPIESFSPLPR